MAVFFLPLLVVGWGQLRTTSEVKKGGEGDRVAYSVTAKK